MKSAAAGAVPLHSNGNGNGHAVVNGASTIAAVGTVGTVVEPILMPRLTAQGLRKLLERENNPCGPGLLVTRLQAVKEAQQQDEAKLLAGALEDLAAAAVGWSYRVRSQAGIWPKSKPQ